MQWKRVRCNHCTARTADCTQSRWPATDAQGIFLTKINMPNYPPNQWQLEDMQNDSFKASWHTLSWTWMWSVARRAHNFASIWCGWHRWRLTHKLKAKSSAEMELLTDDKRESNAGGVKWPATNQCGCIDVCLFSRLNQQQEGDRDTEMVKQIASPQPAQS